MKGMNTRMAAAAAFLFFGATLGLGAQSVPPPKGVVLEKIIARVNDDIITSSQYDKAQEALKEELKHDCPSCTQAELDTRYEKRGKNVLRDLIDQDLMIEQAKDEGINVDIDLVKELDSTRIHYHLDSMDALRRAVEASGMNWTEYKQQIKNGLLVQKLIQQDVGGTIQIDHEQVQKYYDAHKQKFNRPESVVLRGIFMSIQGKTPAQIAAIKKQMDTIRTRVENGDDFGQLAKIYSQGTTAQAGGTLGDFTRGMLQKPIEDAVFKLQHNQMTPVMKIGDEYELFQVEQHYQAGIQPMDAVESDIEQAIYSEKIQPAMRKYLEQLRKESYITIQPGYVDTDAVPSTAIEEVSASQFDSKGKKKKKKGER
jgi:peptidyl-prolyl cis-trans isomerase SurA